MNNHLLLKRWQLRIICGLVVIISLIGCSSRLQTPVSSPTTALIEMVPPTLSSTKSSATVLPTSTALPILTATSTPLPSFAALQEATLKAFGPVCLVKNTWGFEISPNEKWIVDNCLAENEPEVAFLRVVSRDRSLKWDIYPRDYVRGDMMIYDHHDTVVPYRWSKDGQYLYGIVGSRFSGCCWVGHRYTLLVRLNLETGEQVELLNATDFDIAFPFDAIISDSDRYLFFTSPTNQPYNFAIMDLLTWKTKTISLELPGILDLYFAAISPDENQVAVPLYNYSEADQDFKMTSIVLIDTSVNKYELLINDLSNQEFYPIRWLNDYQILLSNFSQYYWDHPAYKDDIEFWLIDVNIGELTKTNKP